MSTSTSKETVLNYNPDKETKPDRQSLRASFFSSTHLNAGRIPFELNGVNLEFIRPSFDDVLSVGNIDDNKAFIVGMFIKYTVVAGTDEFFFDRSDYDQLLKLPMTPKLSSAVKKLQSLFNVETEEKVKNSEET